MGARGFQKLGSRGFQKKMGSRGLQKKGPGCRPILLTGVEWETAELIISFGINLTMLVIAPTRSSSLHDRRKSASINCENEGPARVRSADHLILLRKMIAPYNQISAVELTEPKYGLRRTATAGTLLIYAAINSET